MSLCCESTPVSEKIVSGRAPGERAALARWDDLQGLEVLTADFCRHTFLPHFHDTYMLATVQHGRARMRHEQGMEEIVPGRTVLLNPGDLHDAEGCNNQLRWHYRVFFLPEAMLLPLSESARLRFRSPVSSEGLLWNRLMALHDSLDERVTLLERSTALARMLESLAPQLEAGSIDHGGVLQPLSLDRVRQYLQANWAGSVLLDDLADVAGLSRFHLLRTFRQQYGLAPHAFQLQLRVDRAKKMLFDGMPAREAALECGFFDQAHLTRTMRRFTGVTPGRVAAISSKS